MRLLICFLATALPGVSMISAQPPPTPGEMIQTGDSLLREGQIGPANQWFERAIAIEPTMKPHLWQYGISLFFAGRYDDARRLFEQHRKVNPHDVENAAWHFLCVAKADGIEAARELRLPAPGDPRVPMAEVLDRLGGGTSDAILAAVERERGKPTYQDAAFYGDLYLGLIADAEGDRELAAERLGSASQTTLSHYMADIARVYERALRL